MTRPGPSALQFASGSSEQTERLGEVLGAWLRPGDIVLLHGDLGAGKTTLTKGIARAVGVVGTVASPSFALVNEYALPALRLLHLDLYRLDDPDELETIGFGELTSADEAIVVIEWPERAASSLPDRYLLVEILHAGEGQRTLRVSGTPAGAWHERLLKLQIALASG